MGDVRGDGRLNTITRILQEIHDELSTLDEGALADYIPELAQVDADRFGIVLTTPDGSHHSIGDTSEPFTIQSVSKAFVYGLMLDEAGTEATEARVDLEPSGDAFNEISLDPDTSKPMNAMINAGAIAITGLVPGSSVDERFAWLRERLGAFAGRPLGFDRAVYESERDTGHRNRAIGHLLLSGGIVGADVEQDLDLYFRQCSVSITCEDLAVMGATLANGGVNPKTDERVLSGAAVERVLSVMSSSGMYDSSGSWIAQVGLPAKSGVGGGIVAVLPGQLSLAVHSPRLDAQGNSARGIATFRELSRRFNLHVFNTPTLACESVRRVSRLRDTGSRRQWPLAQRLRLEELGEAVAIIEVQGDLFFAAIERLSRAIDDLDGVDTFVLDLSRVGVVDPLAPSLLAELTADIHTRSQKITIVDPAGRLGSSRPGTAVPEVDGDLDLALERIEHRLLELDLVIPRVPLDDCDIFAGLDPGDVADLRRELRERELDAGSTLCRTGEPGESLFVLTAGNLEVRFEGTKIASISPGTCVGEIAVIAGGPRSADVVATIPSACFELTRASLNRIESGRPRLYTKIIRNVLRTNLEGMRRRTSGSD
ncbi:MAG: glutaminase A [Ilumatobacter sp.]